MYHTAVVIWCHSTRLLQYYSDAVLKKLQCNSAFFSAPFSTWYQGSFENFAFILAPFFHTNNCRQIKLIFQYDAIIAMWFQCREDMQCPVWHKDKSQGEYSREGALFLTVWFDWISATRIYFTTPGSTLLSLALRLNLNCLLWWKQYSWRFATINHPLK